MSHPYLLLCASMCIYNINNNNADKYFFFRVKKLLKQIDKLQLQLAEARATNRDLKTQLTDAADYKVSNCHSIFAKLNY